MPSKRKKNKRRMRRVAASIPEAPVSAPDQFETHDEPLLKAEVEAEIVAKVQAEVEAVVEPESGPVVEAVAAPVVETEEVVIDTEDSPEVEAEVIPMVNADAIPEEVEVEEAPVVTEDEPVTTEAPEEVPVETEIIPETLSEPVVAPVHEAPVANVAPSEPLVEAKEGIEAQMEIKSKKDATDENTALDVLSGHFSAPQPVISELQCHTQLASAPVELASVDIPAEAALNGHTATEVAIEG
ncbi:E3 ubiquitin-protein ligase RNF12-B isoform X2 [Oncorhynchus mykiss]|uniref:E3 ubiquitin-protein ligase RNF12-B isoform X2 n=1 Tax=Oncorhynchus mykiss TaxID=8022 RepID=UPI001878BB92|nr:E3 ubiquitin-protein ligase RNF12-B isoform X2 [Oncorhynchus mykiss]